MTVLGNIASNFNIDLIPAWSAFSSVDRSVAAATWTKVLCDTEEYTATVHYDDANSRAVPQRAGAYLIGGSVFFTAAQTDIGLSLYKNGVEAKRLAGGLSSQSVNGSAMVRSNGTNDYFELFVFTAGASTIWGQTSPLTYVWGYFLSE